MRVFSIYLFINNSEARIDWSQSMEKDPCNRKLAALIGNDGNMNNPKIFYRKYLSHSNRILT